MDILSTSFRGFWVKFRSLPLCWLFGATGSLDGIQLNLGSFSYILMLTESNERLQTHLKERMHSLEEKNHLSNELDRTKKKVEDSEQSKARLQLQVKALKAELGTLEQLYSSTTRYGGLLCRRH